MKSTPRLLSAILLILLAYVCSTAASASTQDNALAIVKDGAPACKLVVVAGEKSIFLVNRSADLVAGTVDLWTGIKLPSTRLDDAHRELPAEPAIVFTTLDALKQLLPDVSSKSEFAKAAEIDEQGFICVPLTRNNVRQLFVVSQTARGVFNGALYLREFCLDGTKQNLMCEFQPIVRSPQMGGRGVYALSIWKNEAEYTADDWETIFESFARDGMDRIYFWVSGHFPSQKFPQTYRGKTVEGGKTYDTTVDSKIGTVDDLQKIVDSAHKLGLKIYLGGGLGCWCGTINLTNHAPGTMKVGNKDASLCPSHPQSRRTLVEYYQELFAALPAADGLFIESADEVGDCDCEACSRPLDALGSKQFGEAQLSLCQEIMAAVWRDHPHARLAYTIGYPEHAKDVAYYKRIQQFSKDPRFEWMEARNSWTFPGANAEPQTAGYISGHAMRWKEYHKIPLAEFVAETNRARKEGWYGMLTTFSPGFGSGSFYNDIPYPTEILPYALNGFVFREATWDPTLSAEALVDRTQKRFFGSDAPKHLAADIWKLREIIRTRRGLSQVDEIEKHIQEARADATPKTSQGLDLMTRATVDIRKHLMKKRAAK